MKVLESFALIFGVAYIVVFGVILLILVWSFFKNVIFVKRKF